MKKLVVLVFGIMLVFPMVVNAAFSDVAENHWAYPYITELSEKGIINGMTKDTYVPSGTLTKGQYIKLIISASLPNFDFSKIESDFNHWAAPYVKIAENYGVIEKGEINSSNIDEPITRIDVVRILSMSDIAIRNAVQITFLNLEDYFTDTGSLNDLERYTLIHALGLEIINGYEDGTFRPQNNLTRAEASKILSLYMKR